MKDLKPFITSQGVRFMQFKDGSIALNGRATCEQLMTIIGITANNFIVELSHGKIIISEKNENKI